MHRPRLLLVPGISKLEWQIAPLLEEWADVATYDPPGVGSEPGPWSLEACTQRALSELDRQGWDEYVLLADGWGSWFGVDLLRAHPRAVQAMALGHAALSPRMSGDRAPLRGEIWAALRQLVAQDRAEFTRFALTQFTRDGYDEELAAQMIEQLPSSVLSEMLEVGSEVDYDLQEVLAPLRIPVLFAKHEECLLFTDEGFDDAVAAFPEARTCSVPEVCAVSAVFAEAVRSLCEDVRAA